MFLGSGYISNSVDLRAPSVTSFFFVKPLKPLEVHKSTQFFSCHARVHRKTAVPLPYIHMYKKTTHEKRKTTPLRPGLIMYVVCACQSLRHFYIPGFYVPARQYIFSFTCAKQQAAFLGTSRRMHVCVLVHAHYLLLLCCFFPQVYIQQQGACGSMPTPHNYKAVPPTWLKFGLTAAAGTQVSSHYAAGVGCLLCFSTTTDGVREGARACLFCCSL